MPDLNFTPTPGSDRISLDPGSRMAFTWSVWPFLSSLIAAFSVCQSPFCNHEGWRGKGKSEWEHYLAKDSRTNLTASSSRGAQLQSPAELALLWKYTKPAAAREQKTCFCLCPCACYSSHRHPSSVGCEQGTAHHKGHLPLVQLQTCSD